MTPGRLRECLQTLRWSQRELARALALDEREVRRMAAGQVPIPAALAAWLNAVAGCIAHHPLPRLRGDTKERQP